MTQLKDAIDQYLDCCANVRRLSPKTVSAYRSDLRQFANHLDTDEKPTPDAIRECLTRIARNPRLSPATVKRHIAAVRAFLKAADAPLAAETFAVWKLALRLPARLPRAVARPDLTALLSATGQSPIESDIRRTTHLCLSLLAATGLRVSELCALRVGHVRPGSGEITVLGKGARERVVMVVNADVRQALARYIRSLRDRADDAPLFRNQRGAAITPQCVRLRLHALTRGVKIGKRITPHMLRHTAATLLLEGGVDIRFVQRLLGHASIATTQIYTHVTDIALRHALERADVMRAFC